LAEGADLVMHVHPNVKYAFFGTNNHCTFKKDCKLQCSLARSVEENGITKYVVKVLWSKPSDYREIIVDPSSTTLEHHWKYSVVETDDHLAMLLGHELAHVVHGHTSKSVNLAAKTKGLQLVFLSVLDPTGLFTLLIEVLMGSALHYGVSLPNSRHNELEADATGLRITARALYDPHEASVFFERMSAFSEATGQKASPSWTSTHPKHEDRIAALRKQEASAREYYEIQMKQANKQVKPPVSRINWAWPMKGNLFDTGVSSRDFVNVDEVASEIDADEVDSDSLLP